VTVDDPTRVEHRDIARELGTSSTGSSTTHPTTVAPLDVLGDAGGTPHVPGDFDPPPRQIAPSSVVVVFPFVP
jgi:hypothetical protein